MSDEKVIRLSLTPVQLQQETLRRVIDIQAQSKALIHVLIAEVGQLLDQASPHSGLGPRSSELLAEKFDLAYRRFYEDSCRDIFPEVLEND